MQQVLPWNQVSKTSFLSSCEEISVLCVHSLENVLFLYIIISFVQSQRKELGKSIQVALVIMDVFRGQITDNVISLLRDNNIHNILVPNNMTQLFQPLDLTVNKHCKSYLKQLFTEWYAQQIKNQLSLWKIVEEIKIEFRLTTLKPLHAK